MKKSRRKKKKKKNPCTTQSSANGSHTQLVQEESKKMTDSIFLSQHTADPSAVDHETTRHPHGQDTNTAMTHTTRPPEAKVHDRYPLERDAPEAHHEESTAATTADTPMATS